MTYSEQYEGYKWVKVKRQPPLDPDKSWEQRFLELQDHHLKETTFLFDEIRGLAQRVDNDRADDNELILKLLYIAEICVSSGRQLPPDYHVTLGMARKRMESCSD